MSVKRAIWDQLLLLRSAEGLRQLGIWVPLAIFGLVIDYATNWVTAFWTVAALVAAHANVFRLIPSLARLFSRRRSLMSGLVAALVLTADAILIYAGFGVLLATAVIVIVILYIGVVGFPFGRSGSSS